MDIRSMEKGVGPGVRMAVTTIMTRKNYFLLSLRVWTRKLGETPLNTVVGGGIPIFLEGIIVGGCWG